MARHLRRTGLVVSLVVMLLPIAAASSAGAKPAANEFRKSAEAGTSAFAEWGTCSSEGGGLATCISTNVFLAVTRVREHGSGAVTRKEVCFERFAETFDEETGEGASFTSEIGCAPATTKASSIKRDLSRAVIAPTTVTVQRFLCDEEDCSDGGTRTLMVSGTFIAVGPMTRATFREFSDSGFCVFRQRFHGKLRVATFSGTVDGDVLQVEAGDDIPHIRQGSFSTSSTCPPEEE